LASTEREIELRVTGCSRRTRLAQVSMEPVVMRPKTGLLTAWRLSSGP
jgi:hypothetical protein